MKRLLPTPALLLALLLAPAAAHADGARVRLSYRAAEGCPDEEAFVAAVRQQARPFLRAPRSAARVRALDASIRQDGEAFVGLVRVREAGGSISERDVRGATCGEVFSALSLVAAITIDTGPPEPNPPPPEPEPPPPLPQRPWIVGATLSGGAFFGMARDPALGAQLGLDLTPPVNVPIRLQLSAAFAGSKRTSTIEGQADFQWFAGRIGAAVTPLVAGPLSLHLTTSVGAGFVRGYSLAPAAPYEELRPWIDLTLGGLADWMFAPWIGVEIGGGALVPFIRPRWVFEDEGGESLIHVTPALGGYVTAGVRLILSR